MNSLKKVTIAVLAFMFIFSSQTVTANAASGFKDVTKEMTAYEDIMTLTNKQIISGYEDNTFRPYNQLTRAQGAIILGRAIEIDTNKKGTHTFKDVNSKVSGHEYIDALTNAGIFDKAEKFNPYKPLTRAQMAKVLAESFQLTGTSKKHFSDVQTNNWAYPYVQALVAADITTGTTKTLFSPEKTLTRAQMASFIHRSLQYASNETDNDKSKFSKIADEIFILTNKERAKQGLPALKRHQGVENLAMKKAKDMYDNNYFSHESPVYGSAFDMMKKNNITYAYAAENIAFGYTSPDAVVKGWMDSPGHRKNILNKNYTHIGIGYYEPINGKNGDKKMVQMFIKPK